MEPVRPSLDCTDGQNAQVATVSRTSSPPPLDSFNPSVIAEYWCHTQVRVTKMKYIWTISNFSFCREELGEVVKSSIFSSGPNDKLKWCLRINPKGLDEESREYLSLYLLLVNCGTKGEARAKFKFSILNAKREETKAMESQRAYRFVQGKDWGFKKFIRRDVLMDEASGLLPNDRLTILCEVSVVGETLSDSGRINNQQIAIPECRLQDDIGSLLFKQLLTDVTLAVVSSSPTSGLPSAYSQLNAEQSQGLPFPSTSRVGSCTEPCESASGPGDDLPDEDDDEAQCKGDSLRELDDGNDEEDEREPPNLEDADALPNTFPSSDALASDSVPAASDDRGIADALCDGELITSLHALTDGDPASQVDGPTRTPTANDHAAGQLGESLQTTPAGSFGQASPSRSAVAAAHTWLTGSATVSGPPPEFCSYPSHQLTFFNEPGLGISTSPKSGVVPGPPGSSSACVSTTHVAATQITCSCDSYLQSQALTPGNCQTSVNSSSGPAMCSTPQAHPTASSPYPIGSAVVGSTSSMNPGASDPCDSGRHTKTEDTKRSGSLASATTTSSSTMCSTTQLPGPRATSSRSHRRCPIVQGRSSCSASSTTAPSRSLSTKTAPLTTGLVLRQFSAHKAILAARSPVFAAMFEHGMEESRANRVEITDIEPDTLAEVLRFIYTGQVVGLEKMAQELLAAADKYQLERLKTMCEDALVENLTVETACDILSLADVYNAEQLKAHTLEYLMLHAHEVCETEGYERLVRHRPHLLNECFRTLACQQLPLRCWARKRPRQS